MAEKIKTRMVNKDIKVLKKSVSTVSRVPKGIKDKAKSFQQDEEESASCYAQNRIWGATGELAGKGTRQIYRHAKQRMGKIRNKEQEKPSVSFSAEGQADRFSERKMVKRGLEPPAGRGQIKTREVLTGWNVHDKKSAQGNIKRNRQTIKTSEYTKKTAVKTSTQFMKAWKRAEIKAAKDAKKAVQTAKQAEKESREMTKMVVRAVKRAVRRLTLATKSLIVLMGSGVGVAVAVILIIMLIGVAICSPFGIFFSGESNSKSEKTMSEVVSDINGEYQAKIEEIRKKNPHDVPEMSEAKASWREVLSIYAVKTCMDSFNPQEVATLDEEKEKLLRDIFWEMNVITHHTKKKTEVIKIERMDENGNIKQQEKEVIRIYLYIQVTHKSAVQMAEQYGFTKEQIAELTELLAEKNADLWNSVLYGTSIGGGSGNIVEIACSQLGNVGGQIYWSWYGFSNRVSWCACFVSWCANQCGYIDSGMIPKFSLCTDGVAWFQKRNQWKGQTYTPMPGDIIFFDWDGDGKADHVGIVEKVKEGLVYTIEGNTDDSCKQHSYSIGNSRILGYGVPDYKE